MNGVPDSPRERIRNAFCSGEVTRYHCAPTVAPQSVGQHSWGVALLCQYLLDGRASSALLTEALMHDLAELYTGDLPFTVKRDFPNVRTMFHDLESRARADRLPLFPLPQLLPEEVAILKLADTLDGWIWCRRHEVQGGPIMQRWEASLEKAFEKFSTILGEAILGRAHDMVRWISIQPFEP